MTNLRMGLVGAALLTVMGAGVAAAAPAAPLSGLAQADSNLVQAQFHRPHRMCRVDVVRRRTPRGWVVSKVRRCR